MTLQVLFFIFVGLMVLIIAYKTGYNYGHISGSRQVLTQWKRFNEEFYSEVDGIE